jgi:hypothetical protein
MPPVSCDTSQHYARPLQTSYNATATIATSSAVYHDQISVNVLLDHLRHTALF